MTGDLFDHTQCARSGELNVKIYDHINVACHVNSLASCFCVGPKVESDLALVHCDLEALH